MMKPQSPSQAESLEGKCVYFLSDMHLGARYFEDARAAEMRIVRFLDSIARKAAHIYLLGDVLDYWFEYKCVVPRGFVRFFGKLAELADSGIKITWLIGNHDIWIFDYIPNEIGVEVIDGSLIRDIAGRRFFLSHGDGLGKLPPVFRAMRTIFRNKIAQKLYSGIHPRWTIPFAMGWSRQSRKRDYASLTRENDAEKQKGIDRLGAFCKEYLEEHPDINFFIFGHVHAQSRRRLNKDAEMVTLGGWIDICDYAIFDGEQLLLQNL